MRKKPWKRQNPKKASWESCWWWWWHSHKELHDLDIPNQISPFTPAHQPGVHLPFPVLCNSVTKVIDFFLFFFCNAYAWHAVMSKPYCGGKHSTWIETTAEEISKLSSNPVHGPCKCIVLSLALQCKNPIPWVVGTYTDVAWLIQGFHGSCTHCRPFQGVWAG